MTDIDEDFKKEKPWNMESWEDLREALAEMKPRSKLYEIVKSEVVKRGHWRRSSHGAFGKKER